MTLPESLESVGSYAFSECTNLTGIELHGNVRTIGNYAFADCDVLEEVSLPEGVTSVGSYAFSGCDNLRSVSLPNSLKTVSGYLFQNCASLSDVKLGNEVTTLQAYAFSGCTGLTQIELPDSVTTMSGLVFDNCGNLTTANFPRSWTSVPDTTNDSRYNSNYSPFAGSGIREMEVPEDVTALPATAFRSMTSLRTITLPEGLQSIGNYAFYGCTNLNGLELPASLTKLGAYAFANTHSIYTLVVPEGIVSLGNGVWENSIGLRSIYLNGKIATLPSYLFSGCAGLVSVTLDEGVEKISDYAFNNCSNLVSIEIPETVTSVADRAFDNCPKLTIYCYANSAAHLMAERRGINFKLIDDHEHSFVPSVDTPATCTLGGTQHMTCSVCGYHYIELVPELGHDFEEVLTEDVPATCTSTGESSYHCSRCTERTGVTTTPMLPHPYGEPIIEKEATLFEEGLSVRECEVCGDREETILPKLEPQEGEEGRFGLAHFTVVNATNLSPIAGATIEIATKKYGSGTLVTDARGRAKQLLPIGRQPVIVKAQGMMDRLVTVNITSGECTIPTIGLSATDLVQGEVSVKEMTYQEIVDAGIDVNDPANQHVYKYEVHLGFIPTVDVLNMEFYFDFSGGMIGPGGIRHDGDHGDGDGSSTGKPGWQVLPTIIGEGYGGFGTFYYRNAEADVTVYPVSEYFYLIIYGEVHWLKEMFDVELRVVNTSMTDTLTNCSATLNLPKGLSLARMVGDQQSLYRSLGTISSGASNSVHWYVAGDDAGSYRPSVSLTGTLQPFGESVQREYTVSQPIEVLGGKAMHLTYYVPDAAYYGKDYTFRAVLENVSSKPLYNVSHLITGLKQGRITHYSDGSVKDVVYSDEHGVIGSDFAKVFLPGDSLVIEVSTKIMFESEIVQMMKDMLKGQIDTFGRINNTVDSFNTVAGHADGLTKWIAGGADTYEGLNWVLGFAKTVESDPKVDGSFASMVRFMNIADDDEFDIDQQMKDVIQAIPVRFQLIESFVVVGDGTTEEIPTTIVTEHVEGDKWTINFGEYVFNYVCAKAKESIGGSIGSALSDLVLGPICDTVTSMFPELPLQTMLGTDIAKDIGSAIGELTVKNALDIDKNINYLKAQQGEVEKFTVMTDVEPETNARAWSERGTLRISADGDSVQRANTIYFAGNTVLSVTPTGGNDTLYIDRGDGNTQSYYFDVSRPHDCAASDWTVFGYATEYTPGLEIKLCDICGDVLDVRNTSSCGNHSYTDWNVEVAPDEEGFGLRTRMCTKCHVLDYEVIEEGSERPEITLEASAEAVRVGEKLRLRIEAQEQSGTVRLVSGELELASAELSGGSAELDISFDEPGCWKLAAVMGEKRSREIAVDVLGGELSVSAPKLAYIGERLALSWTEVEGAARYAVRLSCMGSELYAEETEDTGLTIPEGITEMADEHAVTVTALDAEGNALTLGRATVSVVDQQLVCIHRNRTLGKPHAALIALELPGSEGDLQHEWASVSVQPWRCDDCEAEGEDESEPERTGQRAKHLYELDENGDMRCTACGHICAHPNYDAVTHSCTACGAACPHGEWSEGVCVRCGYACAHAGETHTQDIAATLEDARVRYASLGAEGHARQSDAAGLSTICDICGDEIARYTYGEAERMRIATVEPHDFSEDPARCAKCGDQTSCAHEVTELEYSEPEAREALKPVDESTHSFDGSRSYEKYCASCGGYLGSGTQSGVGERALVEPHDFAAVEGGARCTVCGYQIQCDHARTMHVEEEKGGVHYANRGAQGCARGVRIEASERCALCGARLSEATVRYAYGQTQPHANQGGLCARCGYSAECQHTNTYEIYCRSGELEGSQGEETYAAFDRDSHAVRTALYAKEYCAICEKYLGMRKLEGEALFCEPHVYRSADLSKGVPKAGSKCQLCQQKYSACGHKAREQRYLSGGEVSVDLVTLVHSFSGKILLEEYCTTCGKLMRQLTYDSDAKGAPYTLPGHEFRDIDGTCICAYCGAANDCAHEFDGASTVVIRPLPGQEAYATYVNDGDAQRHLCVVRDARLSPYCTQCGAYLASEEHSASFDGATYPRTATVELEEAHEFGADGVCISCGYSPSITRLQFAEKSVKLGIGEKLTPELIFGPEGAQGEISYRSSNAKIFTVESETGEIKGVKAGSATLTASAGKLTAKLSIQVCKKPASFALTPEALTLGVGEEAALSAKLSSGSFGRVLEWESDDENVAVVADGTVKGVAPGTAEISAKLYTGAVASCEVTVCEAPSMTGLSIRLPEGRSGVIGVGETLQASVDCGSAAGAYGFTSLDPSIATVTAAGKIKGVKAGSTFIAATAYNRTAALLRITVLAAPTKVEILNNPKTLGKGEAWTLGYALTAMVKKQSVPCAGAVTFKSSASGVLAVDETTGALTAKKAGTAKITAKTFNGKTAAVTITVKDAPTGIALKPDKVTLGVGEPNIKLAASLTNKRGYGHVVWTSSDERIVTVDAGTLTALRPGEVTVTASVYGADGAAPQEAHCTVTVSDAPSEGAMRVKLPKTTLGVGETMTAELVYDEGTSGAHTFESSDKKLATVNKTTGVVKGVKATQEGAELRIVARAYNGVEVKSDPITVIAAPTKVELLNKAATLGVGETWQLGAKVSAGKNDITGKVKISYSSSKASVVEVDPETGALKALKIGSAKITVKAYNGKAASMTVTVKAAPERIELNEKTLTLGVKERSSLMASFTNKNSSGHVSWESDAPETVAVDGGKLEAKAEGEATITASVYNSADPEHPLTAHCTVTVLPAPTEESMFVRLPKATLGVGETMTVSVEHAGTAGACTFDTSEHKYATANKTTGIVKGAKVTPGGATVKVVAEAYNGVKVESEPITIVAAPTKIELQNKITKMGVGETWQLGVKVSANKADITGQVSYEFKSSNENLIHVDPATGALTAKELPAGKMSAAATITVTTYNKKTASVKITVYPESTEITLDARN